MSLHNRIVLPVILFTLAVLAGCGSGSPHVVPPPTGGYNNANFSGTYVFSTNGTDFNGSPLAIAGSVAADGSGHITGGTVSMNDTEFDGPALGLAITGGSYSVSADGRGKASLTVTTPFGSAIVVDFVLTSNTHGLITEFDGNGSGSGTLDLQSAVTQAQLAGSYAFTLAGVDPNGNLPFGTVGSFTLDSNGTITGGIEDFNDIGFAYGGLTVTGSLTANPSSGAPWIATLTATNPNTHATPFGTMTFDVYAVDATHLKFVESDNFQDVFGLVSGDAYTGASVPTTQTTYVFTMGGGVQNTGPTTVGGVFTIDGTGDVSGGNIDINLAGTATSAPLNFSGNYGAPGVGGRTDFEFVGFQVGQSFVAYPTANAGLLMLLLDGGGTNFMAGSALPQTGTTFAASQGYGMNLAGVNSVEEDDIAEFTTTSTGFSGVIDYNDQGSTAFGQALNNGTYTADTPPAGRYDFLSNGFNGELYVVDASTALFVELDTTQVGVGTIELQAATTGSAKASRLLVPYRMVLPKSANQQNAAKWRHAAHLLHAH